MLETPNPATTLVAGFFHSDTNARMHIYAHQKTATVHGKLVGSSAVRSTRAYLCLIIVR